MSVSWRHISSASVAAVALSAATMGLSWADGVSSAHNVTIPGVTIGQNAAGSNACCDGGGHVITTPGFNSGGSTVNFNQSNSGAVAQVGIGAGSADARTTFLSGGAFIPLADPVPPTVLDTLNVAGVTETFTEIVTEQVPVQEQVCETRVSQTLISRPVRAVCIDDTGTPHPASRPDETQVVDQAFAGEIFRCMAGTNMQVSLGSVVNGQADFTQADGFSCAKGEALVHQPGGNLSCAPQEPRRNCNERSLLRRTGPGIKVVQAQGLEKVCAPKTSYQTVQREVVSERPVISGPIVFDGGVGQQVY